MASMPYLLIFFIANLLHLKPNTNKSLQHERSVMSLCQDIIYNVCKGKWLLPKQLLLGMTVRHETGSSKLVMYLNRFGHSVSHSKLLELETAMYDSILKSESFLPCGAISDYKCHHNSALLGQF